MPLSLLCDEHIPYEVIEGLERQGVDAVSVQQIGLDATDDSLIMVVAKQRSHVIYTYDDDSLRLSSSGIQHSGIFYHHPLKYSIGEAVRTVALACHALSAEEMVDRVEFL